MKDKDNPRREEANRVFRQFAWNLAGTLNRPKARPGVSPRTSSRAAR